MDPKIKKVAIIGAGVSGICAAKFLLHTTTKIKFSVVVYEQRDCIGGTWAYQELVDFDSEVISSMYKNLRYLVLLQYESSLKSRIRYSLNEFN